MQSTDTPTAAVAVAQDPVRRLAWVNLLFLTGAHLVAAFAIVYLAAIHFSWWTVGFAWLWATLSGLAITAGYHRLFAHGTYRANAMLRLFYLLFGAAAVQNSALSWAADHRAHHAHTDGDKDPYDIRKGFWWAHVGWVLFANPEERARRALVRDLESDRLVRLQHVLYVPLAILVGAGIPAAIGSAWGDPIGAMLVAGWLRLVVLWHATFAINSVSHMFGRPTYGRRLSARDNMWTALITLGEGYHNFHHRFPADYRNGVRWYHFDPTKWWVWTMARLGLARDLRRVPRTRIEAARRAAQNETVPA
jgi:stearoyl-CoA desaturase (delta-9 desaturase)